MQLGGFKLTPLELGRFRLDGGAMFGVVPRVMWERFHPPDALNRIDMALRCLLIETGSRTILIDAGFGEGRPEKFRKMFAFEAETNFLDQALSAAGTSRRAITDVIITHLHFDHVGGATEGKDSTPQPTFPDAKYYIQKRQLDHARSRFERDRASYIAADFEPLIEAGVAEIVDGAWGLMEGIDTIICDGHTPAMQLVRIRAGGETLVYTADLIPLASHVSLPWIMAYDLEPMKTLGEKRRFLSAAADGNWRLLFEHDPKHTTARVVKGERGFEAR